MPPSFHAKDRTKREHVAKLDRLVWDDPDAGTVILKLTDGASAIGPGTADQFTTGQLYRFLGRWTDGRYGDDFKFETFVKDAPLARGAVMKSLADTCRHIGRATAEKLFDKFGGDAVRQLREEPEAVAAAGLLTADAAREAAADLARFAALERTKIELFGLFAARGFHGKAIDRAIGLFGAKAPEIIRRNPYTLLVKKLPGAGFKRVDRMFLDLGGKPAAFKRQMFAALAGIREDRSGSTWADAQDVAATVTKSIPGADPYRALRGLIRAGRVRVRREGRERFVTLRERAGSPRP